MWLAENNANWIWLCSGAYFSLVWIKLQIKQRLKKKKLTRHPRAFRPTNIIFIVKAVQCQSQAKPEPSPKKTNFFGFWKTNWILVPAVESHLDICSLLLWSQPGFPSLQESHSTSPAQEASSMPWQGHSPACFSVLMRWRLACILGQRT